jgi:Domain of unknown function (DUF4105)
LALAELWDRLPPGLRARADTLEMTRDASLRPLPDVPHSVVSAPWRGRVRVAPLASLQDAMADHGHLAASVEEDARELWQRRIVHALVHAEDEQHGWSKDPSWRGLSGWGEGAPGRPAERDPLSFAEPAGRASSAEDLASMAEQVLRARALPHDGASAAVCRQRAKARFVVENIGGDWDAAGCASLADVGLDPVEVEAIELLHIEASPRSPASLAGHMALAVRYGGARSRTDVYQLAADTGGEAARGPVYVARGLLGGFASRVFREPYSRTLLRYSADNRSVRRLRLRLDDEQELRLLERLDDMRLGWERPYLFLTRNCTHLVKDLVEWSTGETIRLPAIYGPDALLGALSRKGLVEEVARDRVDAFGLHERAALARELRLDVERRQRDLAPGLDERFAATWSRSGDARGGAYRAIGEVAARVAPEEPGAAEQLVSYLAWSEASERHLAQRRPDNEMDPAMAGLWEALQLAPMTTASLRDADSAMLAGLRAEDSRQNVGRTGARPGQTQHSPLRAGMASAGVDLGDGTAIPWMGWSSAVYDHNMGAPRRFAAAEGLGIRLLATELRLAPTTGGGGMRLRAIELDRIYGLRPAGNIGVHVAVFDLERPVDPTQPARWTAFEAGPLVELAQVGDHRFQVLAGGGVATGLLALEGLAAPASWEPDLRLPMRLSVAIGAPHEALTHASAQASWSARPRTGEPIVAGGVDGSLRLGAVSGRDLALRGACEVEGTSTAVVAGAWQEANRSCALGIRIERY